jgi:Rieske Fe-S protein
LVARIDGFPTAVSRQHGKLYSVSAVCTHLGCQVAWNRPSTSTAVAVAAGERRAW